MELNQGRSIGPLVSLAEGLCLQEQDRERFTRLLRRPWLSMWTRTPIRGWISGGEMGSPMWARIWVMGSGSVRNAMNVSGVWQVGQIRGKTS